MNIVNIFYNVFLIITIISGLVIAVVDWNTYEIPMKWNLVILASSIGMVLLDISHYKSYLLGSLVTGGIFLLLHYGTRGQGLGFGDVKLMFFAGLGLGMDKAIVAFIISFVGASLIHPICMKVLGKDKTLAFGPYMILGIITAHLFGEYMIDSYRNLLVFGG